MKTIVLSNHYEGKPLEILKEAVNNDFNLIVLEKANKENLLDEISKADYLLVSGRLNIDKEVLEKAKNLKMVQRTGVGLDNMDLDYLKDNNIPLYVNSGVNSNSVAEHTIMLILSVIKNNYLINKNIRKGIWKKQETGVSCYELNNKTVGLIGLGNIGKRVAELLKPFGCNIIYTKRNRLAEEEEKELGIKFVSFDELLNMSDIVSLHCPFDKEKGAIIGDDEFRKMKDNSVLINTARGKLINEDALVKNIESGKLLGVGLDVFTNEPIEKDNKLFEFDNVILTPHIGGLSNEAFKSMMEKAIENIRKFDQNKLSEIENNKYSIGERCNAKA